MYAMLVLPKLDRIEASCRSILDNSGPRTELVAQIEFTEWTPDGHLRHSKFVGLREDKDAMQVGRAG
jgi:ATP-dependent DNA ligase